MGCYIYSEHSKDRVVHQVTCRYAAAIFQEHRRMFSTFNQAENAGYRYCSCCWPLTHMYMKYRTEIRSFAHKRRWLIYIENDQLHILSRHDLWLLIAIPGQQNLELYHRNTRPNHVGKRELSSIPNYHLQSAFSKSIFDYLIDIDAHDAYRDTHFYCDPYQYSTDHGFDRMMISCIIPRKNKKARSTEKFTASYKCVNFKKKKKHEKEQMEKKRQEAIHHVYELFDLMAGRSTENKSCLSDVFLYRRYYDI